MDELGEVEGVSQVQIRVWLDAVTIASADDELVPALAEVGDFAVLVPVAQAVELEGVAELAVKREEVVDEEAVLFFAYAVEIPERVVEDDEDAGSVVELGEEFAEELRGALGDRLWR